MNTGGCGLGLFPVVPSTSRMSHILALGTYLLEPADADVSDNSDDDCDDAVRERGGRYAVGKTKKNRQKKRLDSVFHLP